MVDMLDKRIIDDSYQRYKFMRESEGDADVRVSVDEVGSAVYRVNYKGWVRRQGAGGGAFFT